MCSNLLVELEHLGNHILPGIPLGMGMACHGKLLAKLRMVKQCLNSVREGLR